MERSGGIPEKSQRQKCLDLVPESVASEVKEASLQHINLTPSLPCN